MPGRPASTIRSDGCRPPMRRSRSRRPVAMPDRWPSRMIGGVGHVDRRLDRVGEALEAAVVAAGLGQLEQPPLGILDLLVRRHVDRRVIGDVDHVFADGDQRAARREIIDGAAVVGGVDDGDGLGGQPREILRDRHVADLLVGRQEGLQRDRVGDLAHADELGGNLEDLAVQRLVEMQRFQEIGDAVEGVVVDEDGAEQRLLGLDVVGRLAVERLSPPRRICAGCFCHASWSRLDLPAYPLSRVTGRREPILCSSGPMLRDLQRCRH